LQRDHSSRSKKRKLLPSSHVTAAQARAFFRTFKSPIRPARIPIPRSRGDKFFNFAGGKSACSLPPSLPRRPTARRGTTSLRFDANLAEHPADTYVEVRLKRHGLRIVRVKQVRLVAERAAGTPYVHLRVRCFVHARTRVNRYDTTQPRSWLRVRARTLTRGERGKCTATATANGARGAVTEILCEQGGQVQKRTHAANKSRFVL